MSTRLKALVVLGAAAMLIAACSSSGGGTAAPSASAVRGAIRGAVRGAVRERREREDQGHASHQGHGRFLGCHDRGRQAV